LDRLTERKRLARFANLAAHLTRDDSDNAIHIIGRHRPVNGHLPANLFSGESNFGPIADQAKVTPALNLLAGPSLGRQHFGQSIAVDGWPLMRLQRPNQVLAHPRILPVAGRWCSRQLGSARDWHLPIGSLPTFCD
jgi:hypothetical protein